MTRLKESQNNLMDVVMVIIQAACPDSRARRDYRMKYPDDILLHQLNGEPATLYECMSRTYVRTYVRMFAALSLTACVYSPHFMLVSL